MKVAAHGLSLLAFMGLAVSAGDPRKPKPKPAPVTPLVQACGECPPGACPDINGKAALTFEDAKPLDGKPDTWHAIQAGNESANKKLDVTIIKGTHENPNDNLRLVLHVEYPGSETGCWIIGITDSADANKVEHYGVLDGIENTVKKCEKVFQMPQKTTNKFRAWKVADDKCPDPLTWHP